MYVNKLRGIYVKRSSSIFLLFALGFSLFVLNLVHQELTLPPQGPRSGMLCSWVESCTARKI